MELKLSNLSPGKGARKKKVRLGRGEASGVGKTSGRGGKGQTARTGGKVARHFEGGQMPLYRRVPKLGFTSRQKTLGINRYRVISLDDLEQFDNGVTVTPELLLERGIRITGASGAGFKLLANGECTKKLTVQVHAVSASARRRIEDLGGTVELLGSAPSASEGEG
jgi:large subunit ribosomal protein L15